jgi:large subunit ribosomal protein L10
MAKSRENKQKDLENLKQELHHVSTVVLTTFSGVTVERDTTLRRAVEKVGGKYRVVKNAIAQMAAEGTPAAELLKDLKGVNAIAYTEGEPVPLAKALSDFAKEEEAFSFQSGLVDGRVVSIDELKALANLPSREELFAKLLGLMQAPAQRLASLLSEPGRQAAAVLQQGVEAKKFSDG